MRSAILVALPSLVLLASCGSLTESECLALDWEQVGLEDGQNGGEASQVNSYEEVCGKYDLRVDTDAYQKGFDEGARTFCQAENGFEMGKRGYQYTGICPSGLAGPFLQEYNIGIKFYYVYREISELESSISANDDTIDKLNRGISSATVRLYNSELTVKEQFELEQSIRSMESQIPVYEQDTLRLQSALIRAQQGLQDLKSIYHK